MECGWDGGPSVSDGKCRLLSVLHERAYGLLRMVSWEASGLENERVRLRCGYLSNLSLSFRFAMCPG